MPWPAIICRGHGTHRPCAGLRGLMTGSTCAGAGFSGRTGNIRDFHLLLKHSVRASLCRGTLCPDRGIQRNGR